MKLLTLLSVAIVIVLLTPTSRVFCYDTVFIAGGIEVNPWEQTHQVKIYVNGDYRCGGTILTEWEVLTAASCFYDFFFQRGSLRGVTVASPLPAEQYFDGLYLWKHENYDDGSLEFNVAVFRIDRLNDGFQGRPLILPDFNEVVNENETALLTSYVLENSPSRISNVVYELAIDLVSIDECLTYWEGTVFERPLFNNRSLCGGGRMKGACSFDLGAPLQQNGRLFGIFSIGPSNCGDFLPGIYTSISNPIVLNFIYDIINVRSIY